MLRSVLVGAAVVVLLFAVVTGLLWAFQRSLIYLPDDGPVPPVDSVLPGAREVALETADGLELGAWFLPADDDAAPAVLVANGNGGSRDLRADLGVGVTAPRSRRPFGAPESGLSLGGVLASRARFRFARPVSNTVRAPTVQDHQQEFPMPNALDEVVPLTPRRPSVALARFSPKNP